MSTAANNSSSDFTVSEAIVSPLLASIVALETVLAVLANTFILIFTLRDPRTLLRKPSTILLLNLALSNLVMSTVFMPFTVVTAAAGQWIFGADEMQKSNVCSFVAFVFSFSVSASVHTLPAISFDRFLFIVKPLRHRQIMRPWVTLLIVSGIDVMAVLFNVTPFVGLGEYDFAPSIASCVPIFPGNTDYVIYIATESIFPLGILLVTTIWTFLFTRRFIRKSYKHQRGASVKGDDGVHKSVYNSKLRNLVGIFGALMVVNGITFLPFIVISIIGIGIGLSNIPDILYATMFVLFLLNNVTNPLVQSYFRKELWDSVLAFGRRILWKVASLFGKRTALCLGEPADRDISHTTGMNTLDDQAHVQAKEARSHAKVLSANAVDSNGAIELNMLSLSQNLEAENTTTYAITGLGETKFKMTVQNGAKISPLCAKAGDKNVDVDKLENKVNSV